MLVRRVYSEFDVTAKRTPDVRPSLRWRSEYASNGYPSLYGKRYIVARRAYILNRSGTKRTREISIFTNRVRTKIAASYRKGRRNRLRQRNQQFYFGWRSFVDAWRNDDGDNWEW